MTTKINISVFNVTFTKIVPDVEIVHGKNSHFVVFDKYKLVSNETANYIYLRCFNKRGKTISIDTAFSRTLNCSGKQNHDQDKKNVRQEMFRQNLKKKLAKDPNHLLETVAVCTSKRRNEVVPEFHNVRSTLYCAQARKFQQNPDQFRDLKISERWKSTFSRKRFLLELDRENGIVIFATSLFHKFLASLETTLSDGAFKSCPAPFEQFLLFLGRMEGKYH